MKTIVALCLICGSTDLNRMHYDLSADYATHNPPGGSITCLGGVGYRSRLFAVRDVFKLTKYDCK